MVRSLTAAVAAAVLVAAPALAEETGGKKVSSPLEFTLHDIKGKTVELSKYKGKVVLLVNVASKCGLTPQYEALEALYEKYDKEGLVIVGVHTPEFERERSRKNVEAAVKEHGLQGHSHFLDNQMDYWRALRNEYWPAIYVVDGRGQIRDRMVGEIHVGTRRDKDVSGLIEKLLAEAAVPKT